MAIEVLHEVQIGIKRQPGADWPIVHQLVRQQFGDAPPEWIVVRALCQKVPRGSEVFKTKIAATARFDELVEQAGQPGRPAESSDGRPRTVHLKVRMSPSEKARIKDLARQAGFADVSDFVRARLL